MTTTLTAVEATPASFSPYGRVFKVPGGMPTAKGETFTYWSDVVSYMIEGETEIGWCTVTREAVPIVNGVERHRRTPEILIPVDGPFILPVMRGDDLGDALAAFRVEVGEAIVIDPSVWHAACIPALHSTSSYFVIFRKGTPREDVEKKAIDPITVRP